MDTLRTSRPAAHTPWAALFMEQQRRTGRSGMRRMAPSAINRAALKEHDNAGTRPVHSGHRRNWKDWKKGGRIL